MMDPLATIVAPATPLGVSALGVVRVSGPQVAQIVREVLGAKAYQAREMTRAVARHPLGGERIDDLLFCVFPGPRSYTGEDVLELFPHGNPLLVRHLVDAIRAVAGVRMAMPGEFTRRAFEAGKLDLVQAEAIGELLHATDDSVLHNAQRLLEGRLSGRIGKLTESVTRISAMLELEVDFAEEEADADQAGWKAQLEDIACQIEAMRKGFRSAAAASRTPAVVFYGAPNAGKSSLVNALLDEDRMLVSAKAGTTRDVVEVHLLLDRGEVRLVDTAGLSATPVDELDEASQQKAKQRIGRADLSVLLVDASVELGDEVIEAIAVAVLLGHWVVATKADQAICASGLPQGTFHVSAKTQIGIDALLSRLSDKLFPEQVSTEDFWVSSERQLECLVGAQEGVNRAIELLTNGKDAPEELAFELYAVRQILSGITGQISTDEILDVIFRKFCIGK